MARNKTIWPLSRIRKTLDKSETNCSDSLYYWPCFWLGFLCTHIFENNLKFELFGTVNFMILMTHVLSFRIMAYKFE